MKWKAYAIACHVGAGVAVLELSLLFGLPRRIAMTSLLLSTLSFGSMFAMWDPFNADPLMFYLGPAVTAWLLEQRYARSAFVTCVTVLAKEFVVMVVAIAAIWSAWNRQWHAVRITLLIAGGAFAVWAAFQLLLMRLFNYSYSGVGTAPTTGLLSGSFLAYWLAHMPAGAAALSIFNEFGALYLMMPFGWIRAPRPLKQYAVAALPLVACLVYVEQPDRALSNFHFLGCPLAAVVLDDAAPLTRWIFIVSYTVANIRAGAQVTMAPPARFAFGVSTALAAAIILQHRHAVQRGGDAA
ncbi:MAG TPA: hypothetical protein VKD69_09125 [Vicinamibacterales bacterium]|nr:hypothetical protein [Vicinamibacterales bacterium]